MACATKLIAIGNCDLLSAKPWGNGEIKVDVKVEVEVEVKVKVQTKAKV